MSSLHTVVVNDGRQTHASEAFTQNMCNLWGMSAAVNMQPVRLAKGLHQRLQLIRLVKSAQQAASVHK